MTRGGSPHRDWVTVLMVTAGLPCVATAAGSDGDEVISAETLAGRAPMIHDQAVTRPGPHPCRVVVA